MGYSWESESSGGGYSPAGGAGYSSARAAYHSSSEDSKPVSRRREPESASGSERSKTSESRRTITAKPGDTPRPIGLTIKTESTHPIIVSCDDTGSMGEWPKVILEKLALLGKEVERYAPEYAISFGFIGDTRNDMYGLQVRDFDKGPELDKHLGLLFSEGDGGDVEESYGVAAYYYLHHCEIPNAVKPILIFILDAEDHGDVIPSEVKKYTGDVLNKPLATKDVFAELMKKFRVYIISAEGKSRGYWTKIVDPQQFIPIDEPGDIVEIIIGVIAGELGEFEDFAMRSSARHSDKPERISRVSKSLRSVKEASVKLSSSKGSRPDDDASGEKSMKSKKLI